MKHIKTIKRHRKIIVDKIRGVSLIELVTAIAVLGIVSIMVVSIYFAHFKLFSNQSKTIDLANENRSALADMTNKIREADSVVDTCSACAGNSTSSTVLVLELWPLDANGNPTNPGTSNYDYVVIKRDDLENTKLTMITYPSSISARKSSSQILSEDVSNLSFSYVDATGASVTPPTNTTSIKEITVDLTNTTTEFGKTFTHSEETKAVLRNK